MIIHDNLWESASHQRAKWVTESLLVPLATKHGNGNSPLIADVLLKTDASHVFQTLPVFAYGICTNINLKHDPVTVYLTALLYMKN